MTLQLLAVKMQGKQLNQLKLADVSNIKREPNGLITRGQQLKSNWFSAEAVVDMICNKHINILGCMVDLGLQGSNGSFSRYANFEEQEEQPGQRYPMVVYERINVKGLDGCVLIDTAGNMYILPIEKVVAYAEKIGLANCKVVNNDNTKYIAAIRGEFPFVGAKPVYEQVQEAIVEEKRNDGLAFGKLKTADASQIPGFWPEGLKMLDEKTGLRVDQKIAVALRVIQNINFFAYSMIAKLKLAPTRAIPTMGVSLDLTMAFYPKFVAEIDIEELIFVLIHEMYHVLMSHPARLAQIEIEIATSGQKQKLRIPPEQFKTLYNIAADLYVNKYIAEQFNTSLERVMNSTHEISKSDPFVSNKAPIFSREFRYIKAGKGIMADDNVDIDKDSVESLFNELVKKWLKEHQKPEAQPPQPKQQEGEEGDAGEGEKDSSNNSNNSSDNSSDDQQNNSSTGSNAADDSSEESSTSSNETSQDGDSGDTSESKSEQGEGQEPTAENKNSAENGESAQDEGGEPTQDGDSTEQSEGGEQSNSSSGQSGDEGQDRDSDEMSSGQGSRSGSGDSDSSDIPDDYEPSFSNSGLDEYDNPDGDDTDSSSGGANSSSGSTGSSSDNTGSSSSGHSDGSNYDGSDYGDDDDYEYEEPIVDERVDQYDIDDMLDRAEKENDLYSTGDNIDKSAEEIQSMSPDELKALNEKLKNWKDNLKNAVQQAVNGAEQQGSALSALEKRLADAIIKPAPTPWNKILATWFNVPTHRKGSYERISRREQTVNENNRGHKLAVQGFKKGANEGIKKFLILIDTSGSVGDDILKMCLGSVKTLVRDYKVDADIVWWSTEINGVTHIANTNDLYKAYQNVASTGGTNIERVFEQIRSPKSPWNGKEIVGILIFTDGYVGNYNLKYKNLAKHFMWLIHSGNRRFEAKFGQIYWIDNTGRTIACKK